MLTFEKRLEEILGKSSLNRYQNDAVQKDSASTLTIPQIKTLMKKIGLKFKEGDENRIVPFRFTDSSLDRDGEVILPKGVKLDNFKNDPVILLQHNSRTFPIGRSLKTEFVKSEDSVVGHIFFFDDETDRTGVSENTFRMVKDGALRAASIGFRPKFDKIRQATPKDMEAFGISEGGVIFEEVELMELSIVTIGSNPNAGVMDLKKSWIKNTDESLVNRFIKSLESIDSHKKDGSEDENENPEKDEDPVPKGKENEKPQTIISKESPKSLPKKFLEENERSKPTVKGRKKSVIKIRGENLSQKELDNLLSKIEVLESKGFEVDVELNIGDQSSSIKSKLVERILNDESLTGTKVEAIKHIMSESQELKPEVVKPEETIGPKDEEHIKTLSKSIEEGSDYLNTKGDKQ